MYYRIRKKMYGDFFAEGMQYCIVENNNEYPIVKWKNTFYNKQTLSYEYNNNQFDMYSNLLSTYQNSEKTKLDGYVFVKNLSMDIVVNGEKGVIYECSKAPDKLISTQVCRWFEFKIEDNNVQAYTVGFGHKGIYLCIYINGVLKAIIDKEQNVSINNTCYDIYSEDDCDETTVFLAMTYWDATYWKRTATSEKIAYKTSLNRIEKAEILNFIQKNKF